MVIDPRLNQIQWWPTSLDAARSASNGESRDHAAERRTARLPSTDRVTTALSAEVRLGYGPGGSRPLTTRGRFVDVIV